MPLLIILRFLVSLLSLVIPIGAGYLLWSWYDGQSTELIDGVLVATREDWRLAVGAALLALSLLGGVLIRPLLGRPDTDETRLILKRTPGTVVRSPSGGELYVERIGRHARTTLLFTHGWGLDSTIWSYAKRDLGRDFDLVFWDLPGLGQSRPGKLKRFDPARFAQDLRAVVDSIRTDDMILIGHSIGGMTIQSFVRAYPDALAGKVTGVVLLNTTYTSPIRTSFGRNILKRLRWPVIEPLLIFARLLGPLVWLDAWRSYLSGSSHLANRIQFGRTVSRSQLEAVTLLGTRNNQAVLAAGAQGMLRWDATGALENLSVPLLVIGGGKDLITQIDASRFLAGESGELREVSQVGHNGFLENHKLYHQAIRDFARRIPRPLAQSSEDPAEPLPRARAP